MVATVLLIICAILLGITVLLAASVWCIYTKLGMPGWVSFVPYYSIHMLGKAVGKNTVATASIALAIASIVIRLVGYSSIASLLLVGSLVAQYVLWFSVVLMLGHGIGFFLGMVFCQLSSIQYSGSSAKQCTSPCCILCTAGALAS